MKHIRHTVDPLRFQMLFLVQSVTVLRTIPYS